MKIILIKDHPQLGAEGSIAEVSAGYARNYLIPRGLALPATDHHVRMHQLSLDKKKRQAAKEVASAQEMVKTLNGVSCTITAAAGEEDKLYGSVTASDIAEALGKEGYKIDKKHIDLPEPIKKLGIYPVAVTLLPSVTAQIKVWVVKE
jgi:large subunit ribosomal protein L9